MEDMNIKNENTMTDAEKEKAYQRALGFLTSSLTNDELIEESLKTLEMLGDYKQAAQFYNKYKARQAEKNEETKALAKKRKTSRILQGIATAIGAALVLGLIVLLVYLLKLDIVR